MSGNGGGPPRLGFEVLALCLVSLLCFCNLAIFYGFYNYLEHLDIDPALRGPLLALEPLTALALRPYLSTRLTLGNSVAAMGLGIGLAVLALASYPVATAAPALAAVRVLHGAGYVILASGLMTAFTHLIPPGRVAQAYGLLSLTTLLPSALMPPFVEAVTPHLPGPGWAYAMAAPLMLVTAPLLLPVARKVRAQLVELAPGQDARPGWSEVLRGLKAPGVRGLLAGQLLLISGHTIVYFFMKSWALQIGAGNPGLFFTCVNLSTIAVRVLGMGLLDRLNPARTTGLALLFLAGLVPAFSLAGNEAALLVLAVPFGAALGLMMPLVNAAMYRVSPEHLRAANANLLLVALDAGFILGPVIGGHMLAAGASLPLLFTVCGGVLLLGGLCVLPVARQTPAQGKAA